MPRKTEAPMTEARARVMATNAVIAARSAAFRLREIVESEAWKFLGHKTLGAFLSAELPEAKATIVREAKRQSLLHDVGMESEATYIPFAKLELLLDIPPASRKSAWRAAIERSRSRIPTLAAIRQVVAEFRRRVCPETIGAKS